MTEETISIPASNENTPNDVHRLCEYDPGGQSGCRRTTTILALEAEYDTFVKGDMKWDFRDQWCLHEDHMYYYKTMIQRSVDADYENKNGDSNNEQFNQLYARMINILQENIHTPYTLDETYDFFRAPAKGFPEFDIETPNFFRMNSVIGQLVTIEDIDRTMLDKIRARFTDDIHPLLFNLDGSLYIKDDVLYCTNYNAFEYNPLGKLGLFMVPTETTMRYNAGTPYFFPFQTLTSEQVDLIDAYARIETEFQQAATFITL